LYLNEQMAERFVREGLVKHSDLGIRLAFQKACRLRLLDSAEYLARRHRHEALLLKLLTLSHED
jgi:hypothetical protein